MGLHARWLLADRTRELFVLRAHLLGTHSWTRLSELSALTESRLWLFVHGTSMSKRERQWARRAAAETLSIEGFRARTRALRVEKVPDLAPAARPYPCVPRDDFTTFRAATRRLLDQDDFERVDRDLSASTTAVHRWLKDSGQIDELAVHAQLRQLVRSCSSVDQALVVMRGAQTACLFNDWLLKTDLDRLMAACAEQPIGRLDGTSVHLLRGYGNPRLAAISVLGLVGMVPGEMASLNLADVARDGRRVGELDVPDLGAPLVRAQRLARVLEGASSADPFFLGESWRQGTRRQEGTRATARSIQIALRRVMKETGLPLTAHWSGHSKPDARIWTRRLGVSFRRLSHE
jgi:hypothetical protein